MELPALVVAEIEPPPKRVRFSLPLPPSQPMQPPDPVHTDGEVDPFPSSRNPTAGCPCEGCRVTRANGVRISRCRQCYCADPYMLHSVRPRRCVCKHRTGPCSCLDGDNSWYERRGVPPCICDPHRSRGPIERETAPVNRVPPDGDPSAGCPCDICRDARARGFCAVPCQRCSCGYPRRTAHCKCDPYKIRLQVPRSFDRIEGSEFQSKVLGEFRKQFTEQHPEFPQRITNGIVHFGDDIEINQLLACPGNLDRHPGNQAWRVFLYKRIAQDGAPIPIPRNGTIRYDGPPTHSPGRENKYTEMVFLEHMRLLGRYGKQRDHEEDIDTCSVRATYRGM